MAASFDFRSAYAHGYARIASCTVPTSIADPAARGALLRERLAAVGEGAVIRAPFHCDYGYNISIGAGAFLNFNCVILDIAPVTIGAGTLFGPGCQLITVGHPVDDHAKRAAGWEIAHPITIGDNCWFGAGAMVMSRVTIGDNCVIAAGAVVTADVPANSLVAGVPAVVKRSL